MGMNDLCHTPSKTIYAVEMVGWDEYDILKLYEDREMAIRYLVDIVYPKEKEYDDEKLVWTSKSSFARQTKKDGHIFTHATWQVKERQLIMKEVRK